MFLHIDRHANEVVFMKCGDLTCCKKWDSKNLHDYLKCFDFKLFAPHMGDPSSAHFDTFLQISISEKQFYGHEGQPSTVNKDLGKCLFCRSFYFKTVTSKKRHISMFHRRTQNTFVEANYQCTECGAKFNSKSTLNRHKLESKHNARNVPKRKATNATNNSKKTKKTKATNATNNSKKTKKTKRRTINELIRHATEDATTTEDICDSLNCVIEIGTENLILWICCTECPSWFHSACVGLGDKTQEDLNELDFICPECKEL